MLLIQFNGNADGRNLVVDTGDIICHVPTLFRFTFCTRRGFQNKSDVFHVLCEELFISDGRLHIAQVHVETEFGVVSLILLVHKFWL